MKLKVDITPWILNFPNLHNEIVEIENFINELTKNVTEIEELPEWTIRFLIHLEKAGGIGLYKKGSTYPSNPPEKIYPMRIQIPNIKEVNWGIREKDFVYRPQEIYDTATDKVEEINFVDFDSLSNYIVECSKKGIEQWLKKGISLKGVKIQI